MGCSALRTYREGQRRRTHRTTDDGRPGGGHPVGCSVCAPACGRGNRWPPRSRRAGPGNLDFFKNIDRLSDQELQEVGVKAVGARSRLRRMARKALDDRVADTYHCPPANAASYASLPVTLFGAEWLTGEGWENDKFTASPIASTVDVNGDGLVDVVYSVAALLWDDSNAVPRNCVYFNTGSGWRLAE